jgi:hypothetical protein
MSQQLFSSNYRQLGIALLMILALSCDKSGEGKLDNGDSLGLRQPSLLAYAGTWQTG